MVVYNVRVAVVGQSTNNKKKKIGLIQIPKRYYALNMYAKELISDEIPPLKTSDLGTKALDWMDEFKVTHLPIVNDKKEYLGLISDHEIMDMDQPETDLSGLKISLVRPFVLENQHVYDIIKLMIEFKVPLMVVLNAKNEYVGVVTGSMLLKYFSRAIAFNESGSIIVLEMNIHDYSLSQIAQIVEGNDAKILSCHLNAVPESTKLEITLTINREDVTSIMQTFERYNYTAKALFHKGEFDDDIKRRYEHFMNYIKI